MPKIEQRLSRDRILAAAHEIVMTQGSGSLTLRRLGEALGVDNTALYRHFRNKDELVRVLGDRILARVVVPGEEALGWREAVRRICVRLRAVHVDQPDISSFAQAEPPREDNELRLTEAVLGHLHDAGFSPQDATAVYHALMELTIGSAAIDAPVARLPEEERQALYAGWRRRYAALDPAQFPWTPVHAEHMYIGDASTRFGEALDALLDGFELRLARSQRTS